MFYPDDTVTSDQHFKRLLKLTRRAIIARDRGCFFGHKLQVVDVFASSELKKNSSASVAYRTSKVYFW